MAKQGMSRPSNPHKKRNDVSPVPEIQGKAKHSSVNARPIIQGTQAPSLKVYHSTPHAQQTDISNKFKDIDNELALDNLTNDIPSADLQDL